MLITRKTEVPRRWAFYAQLTLILSIYGQFVVNAPFILLMKRYLDNPAAIMGLISIQIYITFIGGPLVAWLSDRIWTRFGRRKIFVAWADFLKAVFLLGMPFAPNIWTLVLFRWLYDFFGDLASPAQAMIYEVVPAKQRSRAAGYMSAYMNIGNLVFYTLLLGRFHDVYFMGPFRFFGTPSGGTIMFILCVILFLGAALFEAVGIKETYPPGRKRLSDGRKPGESMLRHFFRSVFKDIFAKDLLPLYLLLFANTMFGFSLGVFQPLLFTEQWGYDLQTFGNTIAIGVPLGVVLGLVGGWVGDRFGKMRVVMITTIGNLFVNVLYTLYVAYQPGYRPSFWEIVAFGNLAFLFGGIKSASSGPLLWEFVSRNRMGGATAGIVLFNALIRNSVGVMVGFWLLIWSVWFHPQAGYNLRVVLNLQTDQATVKQMAVQAGLEPETIRIRPLHAPGTHPPEQSRGWWIHQEAPDARDGIKEREDLQDRIGKLQSRANSFFTPESRREELREEITAARSRIAELETELEQRARELERRLEPVLGPQRFQPGEQIRHLEFAESRFVLDVSTLTPLDPAYLGRLRDNLQGQEFLTRSVPDAEGILQVEPQLEINLLPEDGDGLHGLRLEAELDPRFLKLFRYGVEMGLNAHSAFDLASGFLAVAESQFTTHESGFEIRRVETDAAAGSLRILLVPDSAQSLEDLTDKAVAELFKGFDPLLKTVESAVLAEEFEVLLTLSGPESDIMPSLPFAETRPRLEERLCEKEWQTDLSLILLGKLASTLESRPFFVTVPRHEIVSGYSKRIYEYFFASQILQIGTDIFGILILVFIMRLEKKGVLQYHGAKEDENR